MLTLLKSVSARSQRSFSLQHREQPWVPRCPVSEISRHLLRIMIPSLHLHDSEAAMTGPVAVEIVLSGMERDELEARVRRRKIARADAMRAEIVLLAADGLNNCAIADEIGVSRMTVLTWRKRFAAQRFDGLDDEPRCGRAAQDRGRQDRRCADEDT